MTGGREAGRDASEDPTYVMQGVIRIKGEGQSE